MISLLAQFELEHPWRLCWLALLLPGVYFALRTTVAAERWRRVAMVTCRVLMITSLVLALAGLIHRYRSDQRLVIFATDVSLSIDESARRAADDFVQTAIKHQAENQAAFFDFADRPPKFDVRENVSVHCRNPLVSRSSSHP
jgi:hypothetical protein